MAAKTSPNEARWNDIFEIVCENVAGDWQTLGSSLGFSAEEMSQITSLHSSLAGRCWEVLHRWKGRNSKSVVEHGLVVALNKIRHRRMADIVSKLCVTQDTVNDVLTPHLDREVRMREAFYAVADGVYMHWRQLAKKLGLTPSEVTDIETCDWGRLREKCMNVLYKWRLMVALSDYKVGSLIQALNSCGLTDMAVKLRAFAGKSDIPRPFRKKRKGEAILHIDTELVQLDSDGDKRPASRQPLHRDVLREYALNKIFIRFQDDLDLQDRIGIHPLVRYFHDVNGSNITEVSRSGMYIVVQCRSRDEVHEMYRLARTGDISEKVSEYLIKDVILNDLGITRMRLKADIYDSELITVRSDDTSRTGSQALGAGFYT